jgi:hypothetical protein
MNTAKGEIEIPYEASPEWFRLWSGESDEFDFVWSGGKVHMGSFSEALALERSTAIITEQVVATRSVTKTKQGTAASS